MDSANIAFLTRIGPPPVHACCEVLEVSNSDYRVGGDWGCINVKRAASCLLLPEIGDQVLISGTLPDRVYVIAVLNRSSNLPQRSTLGEGVTLSVAAPGELTVTARQQLNLRSDTRIQLDGDEVILKGRLATMAFGRLKALVGDAALSLKKGRLFGDVFESSLARLSQFLGTSQRMVEGLDQTRSGNIDCQAEDTIHIHGRNVLTDASKLMRVDGDQVHIG